MAKSKDKKPKRVQARVPRGFIDRDARDIRATEAMLAKIKAVYERYGFEPVETPLFEYTDALGKFLPDSDRPNEGVFSLQDEDEQWMSLRYDLTAPLARFVAENVNSLNLPYRSYRAGYVFRNEKPGPGRFRQFMQFDADVVGAPGVQADAEMAMMMADTMEALGIPRGQYVIRVNNRKVLDGVMEAIGLSGDEHAGTRLTVLRAIDKLDKFGIEGVRQLLGEGRKDESGDFTKGAGLSTSKAAYVLAVVQESEFGDTGATDLEMKDADETFNQTATTIQAFAELNELGKIVEASGYHDGRVKIDPSVVRGLEYYTGPVFEAELLFDVTNEKGEKVQFGSVGGGGRYDGLVKRFTGQDVPATGFSIGVSRLMTALKNLGKLEGLDQPGPVLVTIMDRDRIADYAKLAKELREQLNPLDDEGQPLGPVIPVELFQGNPKNFGKQLQYADRRGSPLAVIQGEDERAAGLYQVKDLIEGKRASAEIDDNTEWRESRPGQFEVSRDQLALRLREAIVHHYGDAYAGGSDSEGG